MTQSKIRARNGITVGLAAAFLFFSPSVVRADNFKLTCSPTKTIGQAIKTLKPGDTLFVSGTCNENLEIGEEVHRITLDGQGTASIISGTTPQTRTVLVNGTGITIRGFTITGGGQAAILVADGGSAVIDGNTIQSGGNQGIAVFRNSTAHIINNTIEGGATAGIFVQESSTARIGFTGGNNFRVQAPNTIQNNPGDGIRVWRSSSAQIYANSILNNGINGVYVQRNSHASISANNINGNTGHGILAARNGGVEIGLVLPTPLVEFDDHTNTGTNGGFAVRCMIEGFADGKIGTLAGGTSFTEGCTDSLIP